MLGEGRTARLREQGYGSIGQLAELFGQGARAARLEQAKVGTEEADRQSDGG